MTLLKCLLTGGQVCALRWPVQEFVAITLLMMPRRRSLAVIAQHPYLCKTGKPEGDAVSQQQAWCQQALFNVQCRMSIHRLRCGFPRWTDCHACLQCHFVRKSDMSSFMDDVSLIRPTELLMPPRITSMMHDRFQEMLAAKSAASPEQEQQQRQASPT